MKKKLVSTEQLAAALGVTARRVLQLVEAGALKRQDRNQFDLAACRRAYQEFKREASMSDESAYLNYLKLKNDLLALQNEIRRGDRIHGIDFCQSTGAVIQNARSKLLSLPSKAAPLLIGTDDKTAKQLIDRFIDEAIKELRTPDFRKIALQRQKEKRRA